MFTEKIRQIYNDAKISTKITLIYAAFFVILMLVVNFVVWYGTFYALYTPAERTIKVSMTNVIKHLAQNENQVDLNSLRGKIITGVVLRIVKDDGKKIFDTDPNYPSIDIFEVNKLRSQPFFADSTMDVAKMKNALVYRAEMDYEVNGEICTFYFYRTITSKTDVFENLEMLLFALDFVGIIFAFFAGKFISRKILKPIKTMTTHAQEIAFGKMDGRITLPAANDELTELAKTFNEMLDRLQGGIKKQQKFVSDASHELRTPATVIAGYIEVLERYGLEDKELLDESISAIRSEAENMRNLLENLLFLSRADRQNQKVKKENINLADIVSDVMKKMIRVVKNHDVRLIQNDDAQIFGDKTMIRQMLRIFLDNAVKYTPKGGKISVTSIRDGDKIFLSVADSGIGIAPENRDKIFDRFFRVETELLVEETGGNGLGLSIAKWIADKHDIKIKVESELQKGTTFTLIIPAA